jgi:hypothetical protein
VDLRNNEITIGEILTNPNAKAVLKKYLPDYSNPILLQMAKNMKLSEVLAMAQGRVEQSVIDQVLAELKAM